MTLQNLVSVLRHDPVFAALTTNRAEELRIVAPTTMHPLLAATLAEDRLVILVTSSEPAKLEDLVAALSSMLPLDCVAEFPSWETLPHERLSPGADIVGTRVAVLRRIAHPELGHELKVVVAPIRALLQPLVNGVSDLEPVRLRAKDEVAFDDVVRGLAGAGYARVDIVEKRGQFAVRGGLIDVFPPIEEHPLRVEFWGDEVDEIRYFAVADQRSLGAAPTAFPLLHVEKLLLTEDVRARARELITKYPQVADVLEKCAEGIYAEGMESLSPILAERLETVFDVLPSEAHILLCDRSAFAHARTILSRRVRSSSRRVGTTLRLATARRLIWSSSYRSLDDLRAIASVRDLRWWTSTPFASEPDKNDVLAPIYADVVTIDAPSCHRAVSRRRREGGARHSRCLGFTPARYCRCQWPRQCTAIS